MLRQISKSLPASRAALRTFSSSSSSLKRYADPNTEGANVHFKERYGNFINGEFIEPVDKSYFDAICPVTGNPYTKVPRSNKKDIDLAVKAAQEAFKTWGKTSVAERSLLLNRIADVIEKNLEFLAVAETWGNGKPIRESLAADLPLVIDHWRYFAGCIRAEEGTATELDSQTLALHIREPIGVVGQIIPWNFPLLMATWKLAPALAAGNTVVLKPAEQTPVSVLLLLELIKDLLPKGVVNVVNGFGEEAGQALGTHPGIRKLAFTGETTTGTTIMKYAADSLIPVTLELGGKSPNIFHKDILDQDDALLDKALEGFTSFVLNQGEVCTCPSRALVHESIYPTFIKKAIERVSKVKGGHPLDVSTMVGAQASKQQLEKILSYIDHGKKEAKLLIGGGVESVAGAKGGFYVKPTVFEGANNMKIFQEEIFGPVLAVTKFKTDEEALAIANDTEYGLGAAVWTRDIHRAYHFGRNVEAGRVWINCMHLYPAHSAFGGYKKSGMGRETHKMMLNHYTNVKNMLISFDKKPMGFF